MAKVTKELELQFQLNFIRHVWPLTGTWGSAALDWRFSNFNPHQSHRKDLLMHRFLGPIPGASDSVGLGRGPRISAANGSQVVLMLLVLRPPLITSCSHPKGPDLDDSGINRV